MKKGEADLPKESVVNISQVLTVDKTDLVEYIGQISGPSAAAIRERLHLLFDRL